MKNLRGFLKFIRSDLFFALALAGFFVTLGVVTSFRHGKDFKVALYGIEQTFHQKSPYENPTDPDRPLYRYAPVVAILQRPFLLKSRMVTPFKFEEITPSILAWYSAGVLALFVMGMVLSGLAVAPPGEQSKERLKLAFALAAPVIGYELINGQNKIMALAFLLVAIFLFERSQHFWAGMFYTVSLAIYIPLLAFFFYFFLRGRIRFLGSFLVSTGLVFFLFPSLVWGWHHNLFLLREWFLRCLKPFFLARSNESYVDLRVTNQSLPGAIGRLFVTQENGHLDYHLGRSIVHGILLCLSGTMLLLSCVAAWRAPERMRNLGTVLFLILALLIPKYCLVYTWAWLFAIYFAIFDFTGRPDTPPLHTKLLLTLSGLVFIASTLGSLSPLNQWSFLTWATLALWGGVTWVLFQEKSWARLDLQRS